MIFLGPTSQPIKIKALQCLQAHGKRQWPPVKIFGKSVAICQNFPIKTHTMWYQVQRLSLMQLCSNSYTMYDTVTLYGVGNQILVWV